MDGELNCNWKWMEFVEIPTRCPGAEKASLPAGKQRGTDGKPGRSGFGRWVHAQRSQWMVLAPLHPVKESSNLNLIVIS